MNPSIKILSVVAFVVTALFTVGLLPLLAVGLGAEARAATSHGAVAVLASSTQCYAFEFATLGSVYVHNGSYTCNGKCNYCTYCDDDFLSFHRSLDVCYIWFYLVCLLHLCPQRLQVVGSQLPDLHPEQLQRTLFFMTEHFFPLYFCA